MSLGAAWEGSKGPLLAKAQLGWPTSRQKAVTAQAHNMQELIKQGNIQWAFWLNNG